MHFVPNRSPRWMVAEHQHGSAKADQWHSHSVQAPKRDADLASLVLRSVEAN